MDLSFFKFYENIENLEEVYLNNNLVEVIPSDISNLSYLTMKVKDFK